MSAAAGYYGGLLPSFKATESGFRSEGLEDFWFRVKGMLR